MKKTKLYTILIVISILTESLLAQDLGDEKIKWVKECDVYADERFEYYEKERATLRVSRQQIYLYDDMKQLQTLEQCEKCNNDVGAGDDCTKYTYPANSTWGSNTNQFQGYWNKLLRWQTSNILGLTGKRNYLSIGFRYNAVQDKMDLGLYCHRDHLYKFEYNGDELETPGREWFSLSTPIDANGNVLYQNLFDFTTAYKTELLFSAKEYYVRIGEYGGHIHREQDSWDDDDSRRTKFRFLGQYGDNEKFWFIGDEKFATSGPMNAYALNTYIDDPLQVALEYHRCNDFKVFALSQFKSGENEKYDARRKMFLPIKAESTLFAYNPVEGKWQGNLDLRRLPYESFSFFVVESGATVRLTAGEEIRLLSGFHAKVGSTFSASITSNTPTDLPCGYATRSNPLSQAVLDSINALFGTLVYDSMEIVSPNEMILNQKQTIENQSKLIKNIPNPAFDKTVIHYVLASDVKSAKIKIVNVFGMLINEFSISEEGSTIDIDCSKYSSGIYFYSLIVNDNVIATKKLVITK